MADVTSDSHPTEYDRPPDYNRPVGGIVRVMERVFKLGMKQSDANKES
jgi:hypothetical protein